MTCGGFDRRRFLGALAVALATLAALPTVIAQEAASAEGARSFEVRCTVCHGGDGNGSDRAPSLLTFVASHPDPQIATLIRSGVRAMPAHSIADPEMTSLVAYLHTLRPMNAAAAQPRRSMTVTLDLGTSLTGEVLNETPFSLQLATADGRIHLLARDGDKYSEPPILPKLDWPRYDGSYSGNRFSELKQINTENVKGLSLRWMFPVSGAPRLEATPVVVDGVMYVTAVNAAYALDAATGRRIWAYSRPRTPGLLGEAAGGANRGVAIAASRVFMVTDNAHLLALDKSKGTLLWDTQMTDWPKSQYSATGAPLVIGEHVISGVAGGEEGARGFLASYAAATGEREWQFWTVPKPGEKLAETWVGDALEHGCGATWMSGSYDPQLDLLYWGTGNPCPDYNGRDRQGDNLYTDSVLALKPETGKLQWYYQFTPHDTHDWDAAEPLILLDDDFHGHPRKLLVQANRNGFFFALDRTNGQFLQSVPFTKVTWASGYTQQGRPVLSTDPEPTPEGKMVCPAAGTNWMSASYNPRLKLVFIAASDRCVITKLVPAPYEVGKRYFNGTGSSVPGGARSIRALDVETGKIVWDYPQTEGGRGSSGTMSTDGGLVFFGDDTGMFTALEGRSGKPLWHFPVNDIFWASPMTYMVGGKQYVTIAASAGFLTFALAD
jgi:alcohol dehydrogenase (cytochrome c)